MSDNKILTALRQLDTTNDNHWTADGQPRLETVKLLASDASLNREAVEAAAPGFNKTTAVGYQTEAEKAAGAQGANVPANPAAQAVADAATPPTAPTTEALRGTDNATLAANAADAGVNNLNAEGGPSNGPSVDDATQAAAAAGAASQTLPPEITLGATTQGTNLLATPESDAVDALASTAHRPGTPPELGGDPSSRDEAAAAGQTAEQRTAGSVLGTDIVAGEAQLSPVDHGRAGDPDAIQALEEELAKTVKRSEYCRRVVDEASAELAISTREEARLRDAIHTATPHGGNMQAIQNFFGALDAADEKRLVARQAVLDSGVDLKQLGEVLKGAPIDEAAKTKS